MKDICACVTNKVLDSTGACIANLLWSSKYTLRHVTVFSSVLKKSRNAHKLFQVGWPLAHCTTLANLNECSTSKRTWHKEHNCNGGEKGPIFEESIRKLIEISCRTALVKKQPKQSKFPREGRDRQCANGLEPGKHDSLAIFHAISLFWFFSVLFALQGRCKGDR